MGRLKVLFLKEGDKWAAQCLEHDIAAQGDSIAQAADAIMRSICCEYGVCEELGKNMSSIPRAPDFYWKKFDSCAVSLRDDVAKNALPAEAKIPLPELRVA